MISRSRAAPTCRTGRSVALRNIDGTVFSEITLQPGDPAVGKRLAELSPAFPLECILVSVRRQGRMLIPHGDTVFRAGDQVTLFVSAGDLGPSRLSAQQRPIDLTELHVMPKPQYSTAMSDALRLMQQHHNDVGFFSGKRDRADELESAIRIFLEFLHGYESLEVDRPCVTIFGSARFAPDHPYCRMAQELGGCLARAGYAVMTGGGPGIMEAANAELAKRAASASAVASTSTLSKGQPYLSRYVNSTISSCAKR